MKNTKTLFLTKSAMGTVFIILCSLLSLPFPVPFTLQTFGVYTTLLLTGGKAGVISILLYILLGVAGLPVFSGFSSGAGHLLSPTGGYIWGFILCGLIYLFAEKFIAEKTILKILVLFAGTILCYIAGTLWFMISSSDATASAQVLALCVFPFIIPDSIKIILSVFLAKRIEPIIKKQLRND